MDGTGSWPIGRAAALVMVLLAACSAPPNPPAPPRPVRAVQVASGEQTGAAVYAARIEARHETVLAFEVGGRVDRRLAEVGDQVAAGAVLARLDDRDLRLRERDLAARLAASRAEQADAAITLQRAQELRTRGFASQAELDHARYRAQASAAQTKALAAQLDLAHRQLSYATLTAPVAGVITARTIEAGQVFGAGQPAYTLAQPESLEAVFDLPEAQRARLPAQLSVVLWTRPDRPLQAHVREVAPQASGDSRTYRVRATLEPAAGVRPMLGMSASILSAAPASRLTVPAGAVLEDDQGQPAVWVVDAGRAARLRRVALGTVQGDQVAIAAGLAAGEWVITAGVHDLRDGQPVRLPE